MLFYHYISITSELSGHKYNLSEIPLLSGCAMLCGCKILNKSWSCTVSTLRLCGRRIQGRSQISARSFLGLKPQGGHGAGVDHGWMRKHKVRDRKITAGKERSKWF